MLAKSYVEPNNNIAAYYATCVCFDTTFGRSCIRIVNKIGAILCPCGMPMSILLINEYDIVFPTRVQMHRSDKTFLMYWNTIPVIPTFVSL